MSNIHGEHERFKKMLQRIQFSDDDHLYIIGDAIERGALGVDILTDIMAAPNMTMLLGNHEATKQHKANFSSSISPFYSNYFRCVQG